MNKRFHVLVVLLVVLGTMASAQFKEPGLQIGFGLGGTRGITESTDDVIKLLGRGFVRPHLFWRVHGEVGFAGGAVAGEDYRTEIIPIDARLVLSPLAFDPWNIYLYGGAGLLQYNVKEAPRQAIGTSTRDGWMAFLPAGVGLQIAVSDILALEASGGYNYLLKDNLNLIEEGSKDAFLSGVIGFTAVGESGNADPDGDGLTNREEKQLGTDKKNPDTDGDGLRDGAEVKQYSTGPLKADSDGDGLNDGEEVTTTLTNPNAADTDSDGLTDREEVQQYKTDPKKADTDGDGLADGREGKETSTNPLSADTDGDMLSDGDEVLKHKTDPLKNDSDGGSVPDGVEVNRGSNPMLADDDVKKEELKVEVGAAIVLEGVTFETGKAELTPESEVILEKAYNTMRYSLEVEVEIRGYTDNVGRRASNVRLSQARADAVKAWLVAKGVDAARIVAKGFGPDNPVASNATPEGRKQNRRIEFFRTK